MRRFATGLLAVPVLLALAVLPGGPAVHSARAAEFGTPPGVNVKGQEERLKDRVTTMARDLVGDALRDVVVNIGYLRRQKTKVGPDRIKLPGFNNFIDTEGRGKGQIVPEYSRVRQIIVIVDDTAQADARSLERQLRQQAGFDPTQGDWVKVVKVPASQAGPGEAGKAKGAMAAAAEEAGPAKPPESKRPPKAVQLPPLSEAESTTYLIKARSAYFNGNYDRALDQILQSLSRNPKNPQAYAMLGSLYYTMNWKQLALKYWEKSLELDPDNRDLSDLVNRVRAQGNS